MTRAAKGLTSVVLRPEGRLEGEASRQLCAAIAALAPLHLPLEVDLSAVPAVDEPAARALQAAGVRLHHVRVGARERLAPPLTAIPCPARSPEEDT